MFTLTTSKMARHLGISKDFLLKYKDILFIRGKHYYKPSGLNKLLWNIKEMEKWAKEEDQNLEDNPFADVFKEL